VRARTLDRPARALLAWFLVALGAVTLASAAGGAGAQEPVDPAAVARGEQIFTAQCAECHGIDGQATEQAPALREVSRAYADLVLRTQRMPPGDPEGQTKGNIRYTDEDRAAVVAFMSERFGIEGEIPDPPEGDPARGREIFATNCAACHGSTGAGGVAGAGAFTPNLIGLDEVTLASAVRVGPFQMPRFSEDQIDDEGLGDIAAFMDEVAEEPGTLLGFGELNPVFASGFVFAMSVIVLLSCMWISGRVALFPSKSGVEPDDRTDAGQRP
jgi:ubiquinol-cytochrome c reductase cytochrome c subunit